MKLKYPLLFILAVFLFACSKPSQHTHLGFYWWKSGNSWDISNQFAEYIPILKKSHADKIYFKLYDITWDEEMGIHPSSNAGETQYELFFEQIPVVFISNKVFEMANERELGLMTQRIKEKIPLQTKEIQIDCDWTPATREKYFNFLKQFKNGEDKFNLSVTLRLYAYKYRNQMGIPPVSRAALMLYNFESPKLYKEKNSIFDKETAEEYLANTKAYPLPLDFIIPSFQWAVLFDRHEFVGLLRDQTAENLKSFCEIRKPGFFRVQLDTVVEGLYLRNGQEIKLESCNQTVLKNALELSRKYANSANFTLSVFSLNPTSLQLFNSNENLERISPSKH